MVKNPAPDSAAPAQAPAASAPVKPGDHVYLVDGSGYIFRAYHAMPALTRPSDGLPVGAIHGFCAMLWKLLREKKASERPTHLAVIFDHSRISFRNDIYPEYKAHRPEPPEDLVPQFPLIRDAVRAFGVPAVELPGFEADDLLATYARQAEEAGAETVIVSSDKDLMQLVRPKVTMYDPMKDRRIGEDEVREKFGVEPGKVVEVQALAGDSTDNVPGVPGIGVKTAAELINQYGDLETLLAQAGGIRQKGRREKLLENADKARVSRQLVKLRDDAPVETPLDSFAAHDPEPETLLAFTRQMEFNSLTRRFGEALGVAAPAAAKPKPAAKKAGEAGLSEGPAGKFAVAHGASSPTALAALRLKEAVSAPIDVKAYETVSDPARLNEWIAGAAEQGFFAFDTETTGLDSMQAELVGFSIGLAPGKACYVPLQHRARDGLDLLGAADRLKQIPLDDALAVMKPLLEDESVLKIGQNLKYDMEILARYGCAVAPIDDTMLISYVLDAGKGGHGMDELSERWLGHKPISFKEVAGSGKNQVTFDRVDVDRATQYAGEDADVTLRLWKALKPRLAAEGLTAVYETLERPLVPVLAQMEADGVKVDRAILSRLSGDFARQLERLEDEIHSLAGEKFNIGSPSQTASILFGKLKLPGAKKTATGQWSTRANILDDLAASEELTEDQRRLPLKLLEWRQLSKLKSTYTDSLPGFINPETGRVHTSYALAATSTGRLASTDPNLQNIPVRTAEGRRVRSAFVAEAGHKLISADYSQIELRVLAHMADIPALRKAFDEGLDIHAMTASEMFGVPVKDMPGEVRRRAKAINFGIIYGISAFGLAQQLGISRGEAGDYIKKYFERFPGIRDYMEATKQEAASNGCVRTLFGRRIHFGELTGGTRQNRGFLERAAINAPIQGTAADIIRRAMVRMPEALASGRFKTRMLLQVHDELIFEAPDGETERVIPVVTKVMERAAEPAVALSVPLKVDARAASNWDEAH
jgi:DNA polymerase-1